MLLYAVPWPPQGMFVPRPINSTADMAGLAWRAYDRGTARIGEIVKAKSVTIQAAEVAQALASGRINSQISSAQSGIDYKIWESVKHFYDIQAWLPKNMIIANRKAFGELAPDAQKALLAEAARAEQAGWASSRRTAESTKQTLRDNGMTVHTPGAQLKADLDKIGQQLITEWSARPSANSEGGACLTATRFDADAARIDRRDLPRHGRAGRGLLRGRARADPLPAGRSGASLHATRCGRVCRLLHGRLGLSCACRRAAQR
jgi:hypothetical protein